MVLNALLIAHIAVLGYWLGSELVINHTFRFVSWAKDFSFEDRNRLMDHVMDVDQHVRYALVLQFTLGFVLAILYGWIPGGAPAAWGVAGFGAAWLGLVEWTHRCRKQPVGERLARLDRGLRYVLMTGLAALSLASLSGATPIPLWLAWKLLCFAGVMACGVGIRRVLIRYFRAWPALAQAEAAPRAEAEAVTRQLYVQATAVLVLLWLFIAAAVWLSVAKPW